MTTAAQARADPKKRELRRQQHKRRRARLMAEAKEQFAALIKKLGGRCVYCKKTKRSAPLSVDHVKGLQWDRRHNRYRFDTRVRRYWAEYKEGVPLQVLCIPCNSARGRPSEEDLEDAPF